MANRGTVTLSVVGDVEQAKSKFRELGIEVDKFGDKAKSSGEKLANIGKKMSATVTLPIVAGLGAATKAASDLEQSVGAVESIFGDAKGPIEEFGETAAETAGLSKRQVNEMASVIGASLQGMGYSVEEAATTVVDLEQRAADMAATFGGSTQDAIEAVASALRGERDPIERYGASLKQVDVNARVAAMGLDTSTTAAKKKADAAATLDLILQATAKTEGAFAREQDTTAGATARAKAELENAAATLGSKLLPIAADAADKIAALASGFANLPDPVQKGVIALAGIAAISGPILTAVGNLKKLRDAVKALQTASLSSKGALLGVAGAIGAIAAIGLSTAEDLDEQFGKILDNVTDKFSKLGDQDLAASWDEINGTLGTFEAIAERDVGVAIRLRDALKSQGKETKELDPIIDKYVGQQKNVQATSEAAADAIGGVEDAQDGMGDEIADATELLKKQREAFEKLTEATFDQIDADIAYEKSKNEIEDSLAAVEEAQKKAADAGGKDKEANEELERAVLDARDAVLDLAEKAAESAGAARDSAQGLAEQKRALEQVRDTLAPGSPLIKYLDEYIAKIAWLEQHAPATPSFVTRDSAGNITTTADAAERGANPPLPDVNTTTADAAERNAKSVTVNVQTNADPVEIGRVVHWELGRVG